MVRLSQSNRLELVQQQQQQQQGYQSSTVPRHPLNNQPMESKSIHDLNRIKSIAENTNKNDNPPSNYNHNNNNKVVERENGIAATIQTPSTTTTVESLPRNELTPTSNDPEERRKMLCKQLHLLFNIIFPRISHMNLSTFYVFSIYSATIVWNNRPRQTGEDKAYGTRPSPTIAATAAIAAHVRQQPIPQ